MLCFSFMLRLSSGACALFPNAFFPWGGLPYPKEHAKLGAQLLDEKMANWQYQTLDHRSLPIFSLFNQERSGTFEELQKEVAAFLEKFPQQERERLWIDEELGILRILEEEETFLAVGSGCKSGMGAHLYRDIGIINYGPQLLPLGDCSGFGLAGRPLFFKVEDEMLHYQTRLAAPHPRATGLPIQDSGYSKLWIEVKQSREMTTCHFNGFRSLDSCVFSFFLKTKACFVAGSHKLNPKSLDRYLGPPSLVTLEGGMTLEVAEGATQMEVIPLAGDESFWGADFLVVFTFSSPFSFRTNLSNRHCEKDSAWQSR